MFRQDPYFEVHRHAGHPWLMLLLFLILVGGIIAVGVIVWRSTRVSVSAPVAPAPRVATDPALAELRMRYARGEIDRADYLSRAADLGERVRVDAPTPPTPAPPAE